MTSRSYFYVTEIAVGRLCLGANLRTIMWRLLESELKMAFLSLPISATLSYLPLLSPSN